MNRRETIKRLVAASGTIIALPAGQAQPFALADRPAWADGWVAADVMQHQASISIDTGETLAAVADTIIPSGNAIGALSVGVDKFLQKLIDNCYEKGVQ